MILADTSVWIDHLRSGSKDLRKHLDQGQIVIHPFIIGQPFRLRALRRAFEHIAKFRDQLWITTPGGVASHFAKVSPPPKGF